jgi:hypothetical protein
MHGDPFKPSPEGGRAGFAEWIVKHHPVRFASTLSNIFTYIDKVSHSVL